MTYSRFPAGTYRGGARGQNERTSRHRVSTRHRPNHREACRGLIPRFSFGPTRDPSPAPAILTVAGVRVFPGGWYVKPPEPVGGQMAGDVRGMYVGYPRVIPIRPDRRCWGVDPRYGSNARNDSHTSLAQSSKGPRLSHTNFKRIFFREFFSVSGPLEPRTLSLGYGSPGGHTPPKLPSGISGVSPVQPTNYPRTTLGISPGKPEGRGKPQCGNIVARPRAGL